MSKKFNFNSNGFEEFQDKQEEQNAPRKITDLSNLPKNEVVEIPIEMIDIGSNIRNLDANDEMALSELGASIKEYGQIEPCVVFPSGDKFVIKVGSRRFKACLDANIPTLKCIIEESFEDEKDRIIKQAIENEHRKDMSPREREAYMASLLKLGMNQTQIAKSLHKGKAWVSEALKAYVVREQNKDLFGQLKEEPRTRDVYNVAKLKDTELQRIIDEAKKNGGTRREFTRAVEKRAHNRVRVLNLRYKVNEDEKLVIVDLPVENNPLEYYMVDHLKQYYRDNGYTVKEKGTPLEARTDQQIQK